MILYIDTSAFLKLVVAEENSGELRAAVSGAELWSSVLLSVEAHRAARRLDVPPGVIDQHLDSVTLMSLVDSTMSAAQRIAPDTLRTLDALHLAAALELADDLDAMLTYDLRLAAASVAAGIEVSAPGVDGSDR